MSPAARVMVTLGKVRPDPLVGSPAGMNSNFPFFTVAIASKSRARRVRKLASDSPVWSTCSMTLPASFLLTMDVSRLRWAMDCTMAPTVLPA